MAMLKVELVDINSITPDPSNVRVHDAKNLGAIVGSLKKFGQQKPIVVDKDGLIIAGNGTYQAAKELHWDKIHIVKTSLSKVDATAYAIADNRAGELAHWDYEGLSKLIKALNEEEYDLKALGYDDHELEPLLQAEWKPPATEEMPTSQVQMEVIKMTNEQYEICSQAISKVREKCEDFEISEGKALELICGDYLAGK